MFAALLSLLFSPFSFFFSNARVSRGFPQSRSRSVAARSSVGGLRMTSCDRSPRNAPRSGSLSRSFSLRVPRAFVLSLDVRSPSCPRLVASSSRPRVFARGALALSRSLPGGVREGERNRRAIAGLPRRAEHTEQRRTGEKERKCILYVRASAKNVYTYRCYLRSSKSTPRDLLDFRGEGRGRSESTNRAYRPLHLLYRCTLGAGDASTAPNT